MSTSTDHQDDGFLWQMLKEGKVAAFEALYRKYIRDLLEYGVRMGMEEDMLKDLVQDLFIEIWKSRERLSPTDCAKFYLFKALRYKMIRYHQKNLGSLPLNENWVVIEESVESRILEAEQDGLNARHLRQAIERLPKRQQEIIHLRYFLGFGNQEIAELMNLQYQSATNLIHRSLQSMRRHLQEPILPLAGLLLMIFS